MSEFLEPLELEYLDGRSWKVTKPFEYWTDTGTARETLRVPVGFITDFASVPRGLWNLFPPTGPYGKAAVIHDFLYQRQPTGFNRARADRTLLEAMDALNVGRFTRWTIYAGVRAGGWHIWSQHTKELHAQDAQVRSSVVSDGVPGEEQVLQSDVSQTLAFRGTPITVTKDYTDDPGFV